MHFINYRHSIGKLSEHIYLHVLREEAIILSIRVKMGFTCPSFHKSGKSVASLSARSSTNSTGSGIVSPWAGSWLGNRFDILLADVEGMRPVWAVKKGFGSVQVLALQENNLFTPIPNLFLRFIHLASVLTFTVLALILIPIILWPDSVIFKFSYWQILLQM